MVSSEAIELIGHLLSFLRKLMFGKSMGSGDNGKPHRKRHGNDLLRQPGLPGTLFAGKHSFS